jgi:tRNA(Leu) C34 or U34 (ribose-2'-O)-methylase TrmL
MQQRGPSETSNWHNVALLVLQQQLQKLWQTQKSSQTLGLLAGSSDVRQTHDRHSCQTGNQALFGKEQAVLNENTRFGHDYLISGIHYCLGVMP